MKLCERKLMRCLEEPRNDSVNQPSTLSPQPTRAAAQDGCRSEGKCGKAFWERNIGGRKSIHCRERRIARSQEWGMGETETPLSSQLLWDHDCFDAKQVQAGLFGCHGRARPV